MRSLVAQSDFGSSSLFRLSSYGFCECTLQTDAEEKSDFRIRTVATKYKNLANWKHCDADTDNQRMIRTNFSSGKIQNIKCFIAQIAIVKLAGMTNGSLMNRSLFFLRSFKCLQFLFIQLHKISFLLPPPLICATWKMFIQFEPWTRTTICLCRRSIIVIVILCTSSMWDQFQMQFYRLMIALMQ